MIMSTLDVMALSQRLETANNTTAIKEVNEFIIQEKKIVLFRLFYRINSTVSMEVDLQNTVPRVFLLR